MSSEWKDRMADPVPEQWDAGKRIHLLMKDGTQAIGKLRVADWHYDGKVETATFMIHTDDAREVPFVECSKWRFVAAERPAAK